MWTIFFTKSTRVGNTQTLGGSQAPAPTEAVIHDDRGALPPVSSNVHRAALGAAGRLSVRRSDLFQVGGGPEEVDRWSLCVSVVSVLAISLVLPEEQK